MDETLPFDRRVKYVTLLRRLDEVSQLLHEIGHLLYETGHLLYEVGQQIVADSHHGVQGRSKYLGAMDAVKTHP